MDSEDGQLKLWSSVQAYGLAITCLLLGVAVGYLVHPPSTTAAARQPQAAAAVARQTPPVQQQDPRGGMQVTPDQLKHMTEKRAEPLLAQLKKHPNDVALLTELGKIYFYGRQLPTSSQYFERAAKVKPDAATFASLGAIYHYAGDDKKAIASLNRALQINPKFDGALYNLGLLKWESQGDPKGAISAWEKLLKTYPNHAKRVEVEAMIARAKKHVNMPLPDNAEKRSN
jgi:cytochrome c-type biogenesis protein CcmH/NrfG